MFVIKTISFLLAPLPDFAVMFLARLLFPLFYLAVKKGKWGLKTKKKREMGIKDKKNYPKGVQRQGCEVAGKSR
jgi:hypothetical protein